MLKPGDTFERYRIEAAVGQGGMGRVYSAHDARLGRRVALKLITEGAASPEANERLLREARAAAALDHPNAVAIFDVGELDGEPYIVMELVSGRTLRGAVDDATVPVATRIAWLTDVARALAAAHRRGLVHRDVKPENVMVREDGVIKVLDFGIARRATGGIDPTASTAASAVPTLTLEGVKLGTPVYMAPEQIRGGALDGRTDEFAWGVLAFELLTGKLPWRGATDALAVVASILTDEADRRPLEDAAVPSALQDVVLRALAKRPDDRFASMDDLIRALEAAAKGEAPSAPPPRRLEAPAPAAPVAAPSATLAQRFSTEEVRDVFARAIEQQASKRGDGRLGYGDLLAAAREVGVDDETLRDASRALRARGEEPKGDASLFLDRDAWLRRRRRNFYRHLGVYVIVNAALLILGLMLGIAMWLSIVGLAWGIGLGIHGLVALTSNEDDWAEHNEGMRWWREQMARRHEVELARAAERGASPRRLRGQPRAARVEDAGAAELEKVRFATDTGREQAAEEEAAREERREGKRRRR